MIECKSRSRCLALDSQVYTGLIFGHFVGIYCDFGDVFSQQSLMPQECASDLRLGFQRSEPHGVR